MAATTSPAVPAFSYAQAAKGLAPVASATPPSQAESLVNPPDLTYAERNSSIPDSEKLESLHITTASGKKDDHADDTVSKETPDDVNVVSTVNMSSDKNSGAVLRQIPTAHSDSKQISSNTSPTLVASVGNLPREDELSSNQIGTSESWDNQPELSVVAEKAAQVTESGKDKIGDDDWVNVSVPKVEKELKAAPIPTVNVWQQRKEAQEAKTKANAALRSSVTVATPMKPKPQTQADRTDEAQVRDDEIKRRPSGKFGEKSDGSLKKKHMDDTKTRDDGQSPFFILNLFLLTRRLGKRLSRQERSNQPERDTTEFSTVPPPVGDAASWPTPETANHEDRKKCQSQEKVEKGDSKSPAMKANQKWVPVPYVPTAKFNTPLPSTVSRRGGRPARGSREGGMRGGHVSQGSVNEKPEKMRPMGPPPVPKQAVEQQRGREQDSSPAGRATSAPTQGRRSASSGPVLADQRRSMQPTMSDRGQLETKKHAPNDSQATSAGPLSGGNEEGMTPNRSRAESRSFSRQSSVSYRMGMNESDRHIPGESHAHPRGHAVSERRNAHSEAERHGETWGRRERGDYHKDAHKARDFEIRNESWRDREFTTERSEQRNGRGRGGYRGRGNHSTYASAHSNQTHAYTAPLPQQPFSSGKPHAYGDRHRQSSAPFAGMQSQSNHRAASRSQSIPTHGIYPGMQNNYGSPLPPTQTDVQGMYPGYTTMYPVAMSAIPYNAALEPMALISMVAAQLEYYFSIENLCKDMYLRSNMDSQGWVPLSVIAGFNRIKSLTEDMGLIRHVCQMSRNIEFRPVDDGNDRVRKLEKWEQWVLETDQRQPHAQNDGPPPLQRSQSPPRPNSMFPPMPQMTSPTWAPGPFYNGYLEAANFNALGLPSEGHNLSPPIPGNLPEIPSGEDFSLSNGQAEPSPGQSTEISGIPGPAADSHHQPSHSPNSMENGTAVMNGHTHANPEEIGGENVFSNERMNELHVCVRHATHQYPPPFISPATRTFSHGSIDGQLPGGAHMSNPMPSLRGGAGSPEG